MIINANEKIHPVTKGKIFMKAEERLIYWIINTFGPRPLSAFPEVLFAPMGA